LFGGSYDKYVGKLKIKSNTFNDLQDHRYKGQTSGFEDKMLLSRVLIHGFSANNAVTCSCSRWRLVKAIAYTWDNNIIIIIFFNDKLTIATHYKIKDKYNINNVGLTTESSNTYKNQYKSL